MLCLGPVLVVQWAYRCPGCGELVDNERLNERRLLPRANARDLLDALASVLLGWGLGIAAAKTLWAAWRLAGQ